MWHSPGKPFFLFPSDIMNNLCSGAMLWDGSCQHSSAWIVQACACIKYIGNQHLQDKVSDNATVLLSGCQREQRHKGNFEFLMAFAGKSFWKII